MAKAFDPRKVLKQIANPLLRAFFERRGELTEIAWDELTEHKIEPVFEAWQALPEIAAPVAITAAESRARIAATSQSPN